MFSRMPAISPNNTAAEPEITKRGIGGPLQSKPPNVYTLRWRSRPFRREHFHPPELTIATLEPNSKVRTTGLRGGLGDRNRGCDFRRRLLGENELEFSQQQLEISLRVGVALEHQLPTVGGGMCTSIIYTPANLSNTERGVSPGASACKRRRSVAGRQ